MTSGWPRHHKSIQDQVAEEMEETCMQVSNKVAVNLGEAFLEKMRQPVREEIRTEVALQGIEKTRITSCRLSSPPSKPSISPTTLPWLPDSLSSSRLRSGFDRKRRWFRTFSLRPSCSLSSGNLLFYSSAHGSLFLWRSSRFGCHTEDTAELFVQSLDLFFNRGSPFELVNCKVEWVHGVVN